jgi:Protein of unknown function (DUF2934)
MADEPRSDGDKRLPTADLVAQRAYARYQQRGGEHGRDQQDWFEAERELIAAQHEQE